MAAERSNWSEGRHFETREQKMFRKRVNLPFKQNERGANLQREQ